MSSAQTNEVAPVPAFDIAAMSGLEQLQAIFDGRAGYKGLVQHLGLQPVSAEEGLIVFEGSPTRNFYNPIGSVHGGYAATLLDTVVGCAVHSTMKARQSFTTLELKIAYHRALTDKSGPVRAEGRLVSASRRAAFAEGCIVDKDGKLCATATTTCLVYDL